MYRPTGTMLSDAERIWAQSLARRVGPSHAARMIGIARSALATACAGWPVGPVTATKIRDAMQLVDYDAR